LLVPKGPKGTAAVTARNSGSEPGGAAAVVVVTSQAVVGGGEMSLFSVTRGSRLGKVVKSWRRESAAAWSVDGGRVVRVVTECVELRTAEQVVR
jgi:hypothetical protein